MTDRVRVINGVASVQESEQFVAELESRVRLLEMTLANEARIVEAQANLDTDSKYIGTKSKDYLRGSVERMRRYAANEPIEGNLVRNGDPSREYRSLLHKRRGHESNSWSCQQCFDEGIR